MTAEGTLSVDFVIDSTGEPWHVDANVLSDDVDVQPGVRCIFDGKSLDRPYSRESQEKVRAMVTEINNSFNPGARMLARQDASMVQMFRDVGYVFDADNRVVPVNPKLGYAD